MKGTLGVSPPEILGAVSAAALTVILALLAAAYLVLRGALRVLRGWGR